MTLETVSPARAAEWLTHNTRNRPLSSTVTLRYAREMRTGLWQNNGDSVRFSDHGVLLDGQHRLAAIVETGMTFDMWIGRGFLLSTQLTMDQQKKRTAGDGLHIEGYASGNKLAACVRMVYRWDTGERSIYGFGGNANHLSLGEVLLILQKDQDPYQRAVLHVPRFAPGRVVSTLDILTQRVDPERSAVFMTGLMYGADLSSDSPILTLRNYCERLTAPRGQAPSAGIFLNAGVRAWNAYIHNRSLRVIAYKGDTIPEIERRKVRK